MPQLRTFRALRYRVPAGDLSRLVCPPYDVISPPERARLTALDPHNAVHLELPDSYQAAADALRDWLDDGSLARDARAAIYPYEQRFASTGGESIARGFFCVLRLEPYGSGAGVRAHEATLGPAKEDRFRLMKAVEANISPVLLVYQSADDGGASYALLDALTADEPAARAVDGRGSRHALWMADAGSADARALVELAGRAPLTIADGHHRYETALRYAHEPGVSAEAQYVLALLYDAGSGGLRLRPWHRLLHGIDATRLVAGLAEFFEVRGYADATAMTGALDGAGQGTIGLWTRDGGSLLTVRRPSVAPLLAGAASDTLRWLDVNVLSVTLSTTMARAGEGSGEAALTYSSDARQAVEAVESGEADACFLLNATPIGAVMAVAAEGQHMPPKSTYFEPKAATGLVIHELSR